MPAMKTNLQRTTQEIQPFTLEEQIGQGFDTGLEVPKHIHLLSKQYRKPEIQLYHFRRGDVVLISPGSFLSNLVTRTTFPLKLYESYERLQKFTTAASSW